MNTDIRYRIFEECYESPKISTTEINIGKFVENLLLYEHFIIKSRNLDEIPILVNKFGFDNFIKLLNSEALEIFCEAITVGQVGQTYFHKGGELSLGNYCFDIIQNYDYDTYIEKRLDKIDTINILSNNQKNNLKQIITNNLVRHSPNLPDLIREELKNNIKNNDFSIKSSLSQVIKNRSRIQIDPKSLRVNIFPLNEVDIHVETNLQQILNVDKKQEHKLVESALFGIIARDRKLLNMKEFNSLVGFRTEEISLFESKLLFLINNFMPNNPTESFYRILKIKGRPYIDNIDFEKFNVRKFLDLRESREIKEFRNWIWGLNDISDEEIEEYLNSFKNKIGVFFNSSKGKVLSWLVSNGVGLIPIAGSVISSALSAIDSFLLTKILPTPGPLIFLDKKLPTLFKEN